MRFLIMKPLQYFETQTKIEPSKVKITWRLTLKSSLHRTARFIKMRTGGAESARKDIRGVQNERRNEHQNRSKFVPHRKTTVEKLKEELYLWPQIAESISDVFQRIPQLRVRNAQEFLPPSSNRRHCNCDFHPVNDGTCWSAHTYAGTNNWLCSVSGFPLTTTGWTRRCAMTHAMDLQLMWSLQSCPRRMPKISVTMMLSAVCCNHITVWRWEGGGVAHCCHIFNCWSISSSFF